MSEHVIGATERRCIRCGLAEEFIRDSLLTPACHAVDRPEAQFAVARAFDVPPWLIGIDPRPRFARLRWLLRRWWPLPEQS